MKVIVNQLAIEYVDSGTGPVMLMLHGWKDSARTFNQIAVELDRHWRVVRLDMPGFGGSEVPKEPWNLESYAQFIAAFCTKLGLRPEVIVGHSLGGRVIIKAVSDGLLKPDRIVLIASAGIAKSNTPRNQAYKAVAKAGKAATAVPPFTLLRTKLRRLLYKKAGSDYLDAGPLSQTFLNIIDEDLQSNASRISTPTLLIWGELDDQTPASDALTLNRLIKRSRLEFIQGAGHFVHHEQPAAVSNLIWEFGSK
jgi:pimeloyl-ACP methyl ester carboxylesterase